MVDEEADGDKDDDNDDDDASDGGMLFLVRFNWLWFVV